MCVDRSWGDMDILAETLPKTFSTVKMENVQDVGTGKISTSNKTYESESEATIFKKEVPVTKRKLSDFLILSVKTMEAQLKNKGMLVIDSQKWTES